MRALRGAIELPSPVTSVVMPWVILLAARLSTRTLYSDCPIMSMKPGATTSRSHRPGGGAAPSVADRRDPVAHDADVARYHGAPVPSTTRPPAKSRSQAGAVGAEDRISANRLESIA